MVEHHPELDQSESAVGVVHHVLEPELADDVDELTARNADELDGDGRAGHHRPEETPKSRRLPAADDELLAYDQLQLQCTNNQQS